MNRTPSALAPAVVAHTRSRIRGFTLVEVLVTAAIAAVLVVLGAPSFLRLLARHAVAARANEMRDALRIARSEAMKRGGAVILCGMNPQSASTCSTDASLAWQTWMVFADANRSGAYESGEPVLRARNEAPARVRVSGTAGLLGVRFEATGIASAMGTGERISFVLAPSSGTDPAGSMTLCLNARGDTALIDGVAACP
jgi:type IV fimbrial biogenesis protein FimT